MARLDKRDQLTSDERGPGHRHAGLRQISLGPAIESRTERPSRPRLPKPDQDEPQASARPPVVEEAKRSAWLEDAGQLVERRCLKLLGQRAEEKGRDDCIEGSVWKIEVRHVHLSEPDGRTRLIAPSLGPEQHRRTDVDADHFSAGRVEGHVTTGANARVENATFQAVKEQRPQLPIAKIFEGQVDKIVEARDPLVGSTPSHFTADLRR